MRPLVGAIVGVLAAAGVWLALAGATGVATRPAATRPAVAWEQLWWRAALVAGTIYVALCLTLSYVAYIVEKRLRSSPKAVVVAGGEAGVGVGLTEAAPTTATETIAANRAISRIERDAGGS